jgi:hypothetical protein
MVLLYRWLDSIRLGIERTWVVSGRVTPVDEVTTAKAVAKRL